MCTVGIVAKSDGGYVVGHNRDESRLRSRARPPALDEVEGVSFLAPRDPDGGGTWIAVNDHGVTVCLLNAAESDSSRLPERPASRGMVALELAGAASLDEVGLGLERLGERLRETRSFHLVAICPGAPGEAPGLARFRWDGFHLVSDRIEPPCLFVSSLLNQEAAERERGIVWGRFLEHEPAPSRETISDWLANHEPERGPLSACMHRAEARTVSRTMVEVESDSIRMEYVDGSPCHTGAPRSGLRLERRQSRSR